MVAGDPLISIIIPVYNIRDYVERCIRSVCAQTYRNLEIIIVDDGSTDGSGEVCDALALQDRRIRVIHTENRGQGAARNRGLAVAKGEYTGFVDGDDYIDSDMYSFLTSLMRRPEQPQIAVCGHYFEKNGRDVKAHRMRSPRVFSRDESIRLLVKDRLLMNYTWDKLFRRELLEGVKFEEGVLFEDISFVYKPVFKAERVAVFDKPKYHYVQRGGSSIGRDNKYSVRNNIAYFNAVYAQLGFLIDSGYSYAVRALLRRCLHASKRLTLSDGTDTEIARQLSLLRPYRDRGLRAAGVSNIVKFHLLEHHLQSYKRLYRLTKGK